MPFDYCCWEEEGRFRQKIILKSDYRNDRKGHNIRKYNCPFDLYLQYFTVYVEKILIMSH